MGAGEARPQTPHPQILEKIPLPLVQRARVKYKSKVSEPCLEQTNKISIDSNCSLLYYENVTGNVTGNVTEKKGAEAK